MAVLSHHTPLVAASDKLRLKNMSEKPQHFQVKSFFRIKTIKSIYKHLYVHL